MSEAGPVVICVIVFIMTMTSPSEAKPPHIVFIVADDLGWNDVGWHNPDMKTPNLDRLAMEGVRLNQSYVQPLCTPSRTAFMTGTFPFKVGLQHLTIRNDQASYVPLDKTFLPQQLKKVGYATHAIGKWHLGFCKWECTPTYRGFDTYLGYYSAAQNYYNHTTGRFLDFHDNEKPAKEYEGKYSAFVFAERARQIISTHDPSQPLFLYLPFQDVHGPLMVPQNYEDKYMDVENEFRRTYCGMVSILDEAVGNITEALKMQGLYQDTLIVFTTDNGGSLSVYGNNYPLRAGKATIWEGGTRGVAFVHGAGLNKTGYVYNGMIHAVDWMPTLLSAAGAPPVEGIDGVDQWVPLSQDKPSNRSEFIYNLDDLMTGNEGHAAIRMGDYKLILGYPGHHDGWVKPFNKKSESPRDILAYIEVDGDDPAKLFNLALDPLEKQDVSGQFPDVVSKMKDRLNQYRQKMVPAHFPPADPKSNPKNFGGVWTPGWC